MTSICNLTARSCCQCNSKSGLRSEPRPTSRAGIRLGRQTVEHVVLEAADALATAIDETQQAEKSPDNPRGQIRAPSPPLISKHVCQYGREVPGAKCRIRWAHDHSELETAVHWALPCRTLERNRKPRYIIGPNFALSCGERGWAAGGGKGLYSKCTLKTRLLSWSHEGVS